MSKKTYPVTAEFRARVKRHLDELGWSHGDLATKICVSEAEIVAFLNAEHSPLAPLIEVAFGWRSADSIEPEDGAESSPPEDDAN